MIKQGNFMGIFCIICWCLVPGAIVLLPLRIKNERLQREQEVILIDRRQIEDNKRE